MSREPRPRVAITRDEELDGPLATALRKEVLEPVLCRAVKTIPPADLEPLRAAARGLDRYDWLVVSSRRAVEALLEARGGRRLPAALRVAAVGQSTAAALQLAGAHRVLVGDEAGAEGLLARLSVVERWQGLTVLVPRAAEGSRTIAETLRDLGARVDEVVAYRTVPRSNAEIAASWRKAAPAATVVTSPSAAEALVEALGPAALRSLDAVVAIGPTTAAALAQLGVASLISPFTDFASVALRTRHALQESAQTHERFARPRAQSEAAWHHWQHAPALARRGPRP